MLQKGDLLISEPFLADPNFIRSVIVLCDYNESGSLGFVLNQLSNVNLDDLGEDFLNLDIPVFIGGPVEQNTLHFLHTLGEKLDGSVKVTNELYWSGDIHQVVEWLRIGIIDEKQIRFFLGYSGWGKNQLESEMKENTWIHISDYNYNIFENDHKNMWQTVLRNKGGKLRELSNYPIDPRLN
ncbi:MAG: YqgE/AlgH family protein [Bacteroidota bacterium]|nr:YqgE/AlgH family protein [Bacteroidota bacterium]